MGTLKLPANDIPDLELATTVSKIIEISRSSESRKSATGFFFDHNDRLYFVTNWHVVMDEDPTKKPDYLVLRLHRMDCMTKTEDGNNLLDLTKSEDYEINLYDTEGKPIWYEHPDNEDKEYPFEKIDIAIIPLEKKEILARFLIGRFDESVLKPRNMPIYYGESLMVMGYPLGRYDELNNLPIVRNATVATAFAAHYNERPCFLIDSRLHHGTSGSPILTTPSIPKFFDGSWQLPNPSEGGTFPFPYLIGIMSNCISERDEKTKDILGLAEVFYATLIPEIIDFNENIDSSA